MVLPTNYASDSVPVQQLIIADEERGDRGLPQFAGLDPALDAAALTGAQDDDDPSAPAGSQDTGWGANFAQDSTPLGADFAWMYDDGYGGTNLDCIVAERPFVLGPPGQHPRPLDHHGQPDSPDGRRGHEHRPVHPDLHEPG